MTSVRRLAALRGIHPLWSVAALFAVAVALVGPLRETAVSDDWSYALMVRRLLRTGALRTHDWVVANPVAQIEWGALFSWVFGFSHSSLRLSTLVLAAFALVAFFYLSLEHGLDRRASAALTLVLLASPLYLELAMSFLTAVPFLAMFLLAVLLSTKALRRNDSLLAALASLATSASILIQPFGAVLVPAFLLVWRRTESPRNVRLLAAAISIPLLVTAPVLYGSTLAGSWAAQRSLFDQRTYLLRPALLLELVWRPAAMLIYLSLLALPLVVLLAARIVRDKESRSGGRPGDEEVPERRWAIAFGAAVSVVLVLGAVAFDRPWRLPLLPGQLDVLKRWPPALSAALTVAAVLGAALVGTILARRYRDLSHRPPDAADALLDSATGCLLVAQLLFVRFDDAGVLPLLPLVLIAIGRELWSRHGIDLGEYRSLSLVALTALAVAVLWTRGELSRGEAEWAGGQIALETGAPAKAISSSRSWSSFNGEFGRFVADWNRTSTDRSLDSVRRSYFSTWLPKLAEEADYSTAELENRPEETPDQHVLAAIGYRDWLFRKRELYVIGRPAFVLEECTGGFPRESDATGWWHWTPDHLECRARARHSHFDAVILSFESATPAQSRRVLLSIGTNELSLLLPSGWKHAFRSDPIPVDDPLIVVRIRLSDGSHPVRLSPSNPREASFLIKNLRLEPLVKR